MYCPNCGKEIHDSLSSCPSCEAQVATEGVVAIKQKYRELEVLFQTENKNFGYRLTEIQGRYSSLSKRIDLLTNEDQKGHTQILEEIMVLEELVQQLTDDYHASGISSLVNTLLYKLGQVKTEFGETANELSAINIQTLRNQLSKKFQPAKATAYAPPSKTEERAVHPVYKPIVTPTTISQDFYQTYTPKKPIARRVTNFASLLTEKIISNLLAIVGAAFIIVGLFSAITFSYFEFIAPMLTSEEETDPLMVAVIFYGLLGILALVSFAVMPLLSKRFERPQLNHLTGFLGSLTLILFVFASYAQVWLFASPEWVNAYYFVGPSLLVLLFGFGMSIIYKHKLLTFTEVVLGSIVVYLSTSHPDVINDTLFGVDVVGRIIGLVLYVSVLLISIFFVVQLRHWIPIVAYGFLTPLFLIIEGEAVLFPELVVMAVAASFVILSMSQKLPVSSNYAHSLTTIFLLYPNFMMPFFLRILNNGGDMFVEKASLVFAFLGMFGLTWIYYLTKDSTVQFEQNGRMIHKKPLINRMYNLPVILNLVPVFFWIIFSLGTDFYLLLLIISPAITVALLFCLRNQTDQNVPFLAISMLLVGQLSTMVAMGNFPSAYSEFRWVQTLSFCLIFLLSPLLFDFLLRYPQNIHLPGVKIPSHWLLVVISAINLTNMALMTSQVNHIVFPSIPLLILVMTVSWGIVSLLGLIPTTLLPNRQYLRLLAPVTGLVGLFIASYNLQLSYITHLTSSNPSIAELLLTHTSLNLAFLVFPTVLVIAIWLNNRLELPITDEPALTVDIEGIGGDILAKRYYYLPQVILVLLPFSFFSFIRSYFSYDVLTQFMFICYVIGIIISPLITFRLTRMFRSDMPGPLVGSLTYFAMVLEAFIILYLENDRSSDIFGLGGELVYWTIFLVICLFIASVVGYSFLIKGHQSMGSSTAPPMSKINGSRKKTVNYTSTGGDTK